jgi:SNF2 family DNA or RNA helicase
VLAWIESHATEMSTLRRLLGMAKVPGAVEQLSAELRAEPTRKIAVFAWHTEVIGHLYERLAAFRPVVLTGNTSDEDRNIAVREFQTEPSRRVFIGQTKAAGIAIDLSAADDVAIVEPSWVPADNVQACARAQGFDKQRQVVATYFSTPNSLDDQITAALVRKAADFRAVFDGVLTT